MQEIDGGVEIAAMDPVASMRAIENSKLGDIANEIQGKLRSAVDRVKDE